MSDRRAQARGTLLGYTPASAIAGMAEKASTRLAGVAATAVVARFSWIMAVLLVTAWRLLRGPLLQGLVDSYRVAVQQAQVLRRANYFAGLPATVAWAQESRVFGLKPWLLQRLDGSWRDALDTIWQARHDTRRRDVLAFVAVVAVHTTAFLFLARWAVSGELSAGEVVTFATSIPAVGLVGMVFGGDLNLTFGASATRAALHLVTEAHATAGPPRVTREAGPGTGVIRFEQVSFN